jgi:CHASE2 domain-containing sensor protein
MSNPTLAVILAYLAGATSTIAFLKGERWAPAAPPVAAVICALILHWHRIVELLEPHSR